MGLFSSKKKKTYVNTSVSRVFTDDDVPNTPRTAILDSIINESDTVEQLLEGLVNSTGIKTQRMYDWALKEYPFGVPSETFYRRTLGASQIAAIVQKLHTDPVTVEYSRMGAGNFIHMGYQELIKQYGWNPETNEIRTLSIKNGKPTYLQDMVPVLVAADINLYDFGTYEFWGSAPDEGYTPFRSARTPQRINQQSSVIVDGTITDEKIRFTAVTTTTRKTGWMTETVPEYEVIDMDLPLIDPVDDYFQARYTAGGKAYYYWYLKGSGTEPTLDALYENSLTLGSYYPITYFIYNRTPQNKDDILEEYRKKSEKICKYLGVNFDFITNSIMDNEGSENLEQGMMMFVIGANSKDPADVRYLFDYFLAKHFEINGSVPQTSMSTGSLLRTNGLTSGYTTVVKDSRFQLSISYAGISYTRKKGGGKPGTYSSSFERRYKTVTALDDNLKPYTISVPYDAHIYRKQVSEWLVDEVEVAELKTTYYVWGKYNTVGDDNSTILMIPLDKGIVDTYTVPEKEVICTRALNFVLNSRQTITVKDGGIFKWVLIIVAIVIAVFTYGSSWQALGAALAAGGAAAAVAIQTIFIGILKALIAQAIFKMFVKELGPEFATLVAIVAVVVGAYSAATNGLANNVWAENLLQVGNGLAKETTAYYQDALEGIQQDILNFNEFASSELEQLEASAKELLGSSNALSPFAVFGESPSAYYNRTVHSGNIGVRAFDAVANYHTMALQLPTFNDSYGDLTNGGTNSSDEAA